MAAAEGGGEPEQIPVKTWQGAVEVFGRFFEKYSRQFLSSHKKQYEAFLKENGAENSELLARQFAAAQLCYYLFRYGGTAGVHYFKPLSDDDINVLSGSLSRISEEMRAALAETDPGSRLGLLLKDIGNGTSYTIKGSRTPFSTFGDCDEIAFLIAQAIEAINLAHGLGMKVSVIQHGSHAVTGVRFSGINKQFILDPTFGDRPYPREEGYIGDAKPELPDYMREYGEVVLPRINRAIVPWTRQAMIHVDHMAKLESAFRNASELNPFALTMLRQRYRLLWNPEEKSDPLERIDATRYLARLRAAHGIRALDFATEYLAAFFNRFELAKAELNRAQRSMSLQERVVFLKVVAERIKKDSRMQEAGIREIAWSKIAMH